MKKQSLAYTLFAFTVAVSPVAASAVSNNSGNLTVTAAIADSITVSASNPGAINITPVSGGAQTSISHNVTVNSNVANGYNLTLSNVDAVLTLNGPNSNTIPASANTYASPSTLANNTWGYAVAALGTFDASYSVITNATSSATKWAGVPSNASPQNIRSTTAVASGEITTVWYSVKADMSKQSGSYTDTIVYTGTTK